MKKYSKEIKGFIVENVKGRTTKELADLTNSKFGTDFTESKMKSYKTNHKLKSETPKGMPKGWSRLYTPKVQAFIITNIQGRGIEELTDLLNQEFGTEYKESQIRGFVNNQGLISGLDCTFKKGNVPYNKGKKGIGGWEPTQFKKGNKPHNYRPVGTERVNADGYVDIKIQDGKQQKNWKGKHILIWEEHNGSVPDGHVVIFGDRNNRNFDINNLILVSKKQLLILNRKKLIQTNADLTKTGIIIADLHQKIIDKKAKYKNVKAKNC